MPPNITEIAGFLISVKMVLTRSSRSDPCWTISTVREKNTQTLADLELTNEDIRKELLSLSTLDYCQGPLEDSQIKGKLWVFGKVIKGQEVYIKLKLFGDNQNEQLRVLSFHSADRPLNYPLRVK